jgi:hypothetical protein
MALTSGKNYLPDPGFNQGYHFPRDGGSRGWNVPPVVGWDPGEFIGPGSYDTRDYYIQNNMGDWDTLEVQDLYEPWQKTPGRALRLANSYSGGSYLQWWVPVIPGRNYVLRYAKKYVSSDEVHGSLYVRILWATKQQGTSFAITEVGADDNANNTVYKYEEVISPPTVEDGWPVDATWARVTIYANGRGGPDAYFDAFLDDVEFAILVEPPTMGVGRDDDDPGSVQSEVGVWMYDALEPLHVHEERLGYPLLGFCDGIGSMFQPTYDIVSDPNILLDPDRTPISWIPWLAQFVGQPLPGDQLPDETPTAYRIRMLPYIKDPPHRRRGTVPAILEEVKKFLNPGANVYAVERQGGNMYVGSIGVVTSQLKAGATIAQIQARIEKIQPAGRLITVTAITGGDWLSLRTTHTDWADVRSTYHDWAEVRSNPTL